MPVLYALFHFILITFDLILNWNEEGGGGGE